MARDRQRAKQRRRDRQAAERAGDGTGREDVARDAGLEDAGEPADPLTHASAEVDQARMAEAGAARGGSGDVEDEADPDVTPAPDASEEDLTPVRRRDMDPSVAEEAAGASAGRSRNRVIAFLGHCVDELRRVQWPDRRQVGQATAVVLGFVVIAGGYLGLMDAIWRPLVQAII